MTDVRRLLEVTTDRLEAPGLAEQTLALTRRRARRRVATAALGAGAVVAAVVLGVQLEPGVPPPPGQATSPTAAPSTDTGEQPLRAPSIAPSQVQPFWDPATVADLPLDETTVLPPVLDPPEGALSLEHAPLQAFAAAVDTGERIGVVDPEGRWRTLAHPEAAIEPAYVHDTVALSADGATLVFAGTSTLWWAAAGEGTWRSVPYPADLDLRAEWDLRLVLVEPSVVQLNGYATRARESRATTWAVDLVSGSSRVLPFTLRETTASRGSTTVALRTDEGLPMLQEWRDGRLTRSMSLGAFDSLTNPVLGGGVVAASREVSSYGQPREPWEWDGLLVFDVDDGATRGYLPVRDRNAWYARAGLVPAAWVDADVLLTRVIPESEGRADSGTAHLVTWDVGSGTLARVASYDLGSRLVVAPDQLAAG